MSCILYKSNTHSRSNLLNKYDLLCVKILTVMLIQHTLIVLTEMHGQHSSVFVKNIVMNLGTDHCYSKTKEGI